MDKLFTHLTQDFKKEYENTEIAVQALQFYQKNREAAKYMFGYPAYHYPLSLTTQYLKRSQSISEGLSTV